VVGLQLYRLSLVNAHTVSLITLMGKYRVIHDFVLWHYVE